VLRWVRFDRARHRQTIARRAIRWFLAGRLAAVRPFRGIAAHAGRRWLAKWQRAAPVRQSVLGAAVVRETYPRGRSRRAVEGIVTSAGSTWSPEASRFRWDRPRSSSDREGVVKTAATPRTGARCSSDCAVPAGSIPGLASGARWEEEYPPIGNFAGLDRQDQGEIDVAGEPRRLRHARRLPRASSPFPRGTACPVDRGEHRTPAGDFRSTPGQMERSREVPIEAR
jgi:hypothetical protein